MKDMTNKEPGASRRNDYSIHMHRREGVDMATASRRGERRSDDKSNISGIRCGATNSRPEIEKLLAVLADTPHLEILVSSWAIIRLSCPFTLFNWQTTMRGSERPSKVKWTRPFLEPHRPLSVSAALETFFDSR